MAEKHPKGLRGNPKVEKYGLLALKFLASLVFLGAGLAKLAGAEMMIHTFDSIGIGQWFRYATGIIEAGSAVLLFVPQLQLIGAILLACTMVGAIIAHLFIIGGSAIPGVILLVIVLTIAYAHRKQLNNLYPRSLSSS